MKESLILLVKKNKTNAYLSNVISLKCKCGHQEKITYFEILHSGDFQIQQTEMTLSPVIAESAYEETINVTPIVISKKCAHCESNIEIVFPISLEGIMSILAARPPDPQMYG